MEKDNSYFQIQQANTNDNNDIISVWESSVKATHDFLQLNDFEFYKKLMPHYLSNLDLYVTRVNNKIVAFMGISGANLEMLFVSPVFRGKGLGSSLMQFAIQKHAIRKVDVNEQNQQAIIFYKRFGFYVFARSEKDAMNKNYPILHMELRT